MDHPSFRERARRLFEAAFGPARALPTDAGALYRWVLRRPNSQPLYVTLDSPEMPHIAHVLVSDPQSIQLDPISSLVMRTEAEVASAIARIRQQHEGVPEAERGNGQRGDGH